MTPVHQPPVTIVVINWNRHQDTLECLASLRDLEYDNYHVVLIDNGSSSDDVLELRKGIGNIRLIENTVNTGFVGGNNTGMATAEGLGAEYVLLLNNDTAVAPDLLTQLVRVIGSDDSIAAVGPTIYYYSEPEVIWSAGGSIDWRRGRTSMVQNGCRASELTDQMPRDVDFLTGCALLVRRSVVEEVGGLEPRFFAYYEETEWCVRMRHAGYRVVQVPQAKIWHKIQRDSLSFSPLVHYYMTRNRLLFLKLTGASAVAWIYTIVIDDLRTLLSWAVRPKWRHLHEHRSMMIRAIADYFRGHFGECQLTQAS